MQLGITTIQRNRAPWIQEWVTFHYLVGFRKFYIYLHQCTDDTEKVLTKLKKDFDIETTIVDPYMHTPQLKCYIDSYAKHGNKVSWMAFLDADEFLFPTRADSLVTALEEYADKNISALGVYWSCFGSNGHLTEPPGLIIENYKFRARDGYHNNRHIKSLVRGGLGAIQLDDPHYFITPQGTVDENFRPITQGWTDYEPTYAKFRINHYICQSRSFFEKHKKGTRGPDGGDVRDEAWWQEHNRNDVVDDSMDKYIKLLT